MNIVLENDFLQVTIKTKGAEVLSVIDKASGKQLMHNTDADKGASPILFPYCGRLKNKHFIKDNVTYEGKAHGFAKDFEHVIKEQTNTTAQFLLEANALTTEKFPYAFSLTTQYTLQEKTLYHKITVVNDSDEIMHFGLGYHPYLLCPFTKQQKTEDYELVFSSSETPTQLFVNEQTNLMTGEESVYFEDKKQIDLHDNFFNNGSIVLSNLKSDTISLVEKQTGKNITLSIKGFEYLVLWSKANSFEFLCIEPWHTLPDSEDSTCIWQQKTPCIKLEKEQHFDTCLSITFNM